MNKIIQKLTNDKVKKSGRSLAKWKFNRLDIGQSNY